MRIGLNPIFLLGIYQSIPKAHLVMDTVRKKSKSYMSQSGRTNIPSSNSTFLGIGQRFDVKFVLTSVVINDVEDNLTVLANFYGFDAQKLIFEWSNFEDITKKDSDDVNSMSAWLSKHSGDYPLLNYLFQTVHLLWILMYEPSFNWNYASLARYVASKIWKYKKA